MPFLDPAVAGQGGFYVPGANSWGGRHRQLPDEAVFKNDALFFTDGVNHWAASPGLGSPNSLRISSIKDRNTQPVSMSVS